jgi:hypothetical protein
MRIELHHLFVCAAPGAPEAEELVRFGLREGPPNQHPGQGTANRRFAFSNAMIEVLWVTLHKKLKAKTRGALCLGRGGLVGKVSPLPAELQRQKLTPHSGIDFRGPLVRQSRLKRASTERPSSILLFSKTRAGYRKPLPSYTIRPHHNTRGGNNVKSTECAPADT